MVFQRNVARFYLDLDQYSPLRSHLRGYPASLFLSPAWSPRRPPGSPRRRALALPRAFCSSPRAWSQTRAWSAAAEQVGSRSADQRTFYRGELAIAGPPTEPPPQLPSQTREKEEEGWCSYASSTHPNVVCEGFTYPSVACFGAILVVNGLRGRVDERNGRRNCLDARIDVDLGTTEADIKKGKRRRRRGSILKCKQRRHHQLAEASNRRCSVGCGRSSCRSVGAGKLMDWL